MFRRLAKSGALALAVLLMSGSPLSAQSTRPATQPVDVSTRPSSTLPTTNDARTGNRTSSPIAKIVSRAHRADRWHRHDAFACHIEVVFGGNKTLDGTMMFETDFSGVRMEVNEGVVATFDGEKAWVSPPGQLPRARFHLLTWPYFVAVPMKLDDPGTHIEETGRMKLQGKVYQTARLSFGDGVGDAPDDWYQLYVDPETGRLGAMAYIVSYGKSDEQVQAAEPHAIVYEDFEMVDGIPIPMKWKFFEWSGERGIYGEPIGEASLRGVRFTESNPYAKPPNAEEDKFPAP